jgi:hypothetical protein
MTAIPSGADVLANTLLTSLTAGKDFTVPEIDLDDALFDQPAATGPLFEAVPRIDIDQLTTGTVGGAGVFDKLMVSITNHLKVEYAANRISGAEYTKAYIGLVSAALQTAEQFLVAKDSAYWQALLVQAQARTANIETTTARLALETAKVMLARSQFEASTAEAAYGLTKLKLSTEDAGYANLVKQGEGLDFTNDNILPQQEKLLKEQVEAQRAQTSDTRTDGPAVAGSVGKQKQLYDQQITSYKRDAETKAAKMFADAWMTQKTIDEGLLAPDQFTNANVNTLLQALRTNLAI